MCKKTKLLNTFASFLSHNLVSIVGFSVDRHVCYTVTFNILLITPHILLLYFASKRKMRYCLSTSPFLSFTVYMYSKLDRKGRI